MPEATPTPEPRVGVVTVSYGSGEALKPFLASLREHHGDALPVAVVDNKPGEDGVSELAEHFGAVYVPLPENPGYGAGMNAGARALLDSGAEFDAFFFCNPDVVFTEPAVGELAASLLADARAGSIGPRTLNDDGTVYPSARNLPSVGTGVGHALFGKVWPNNPWSRAYKNASDYDRRRTAGSLSGAAVMVRHDVFEAIDGWDEAYFLHFEDIDLGYRIGLAGWENIYEPDVTVVHSGGHSLKKHSAVAERAMTDSAIRFMRKRYSGAWRAPLRWAVIAGLRVRGALKTRAAR
jgi:N-acetylglucosaminyl-diphospho-decaprenol L-rhamnosyltransferase